MTATERVREIYRAMYKQYGAEFAKSQILNVMYMEQITGDATYDEMAALYEQLTK